MAIDINSPALSFEVKPESIAAATQQMEGSLIAGLINADTDTFRHIRDVRRTCEGDFYDERFRTIWRAMDELETSGLQIDKATVRAHLLAGGTMGNAGGDQFLFKLETSGQDSIEYLITYSRQVREFAQRRRLGMAADNIRMLAMRPHVAVSDVYSMVLRTLDSAMPTGVRPFTVAGTAINEAYDRYVAAAKAMREGKPIRGLVSGIEAFDKLCGYQFNYGTLMVIFGSTGLGKSTLACNLMSGYAAHDVPVLYVTMEMPVERIIDRTIAGMIEVPETTLRSGDIDDSQWERLTAALPGGMGLPWAVSGACQTADDMYEQMVSMSEVYGGRPGVLMVDTLNSMHEAGSSDNPYIQITNAIKALDRLKLRTGWGIVGLAQQRIDIDNKVSMEKQRVMLRPNIGNIQNSRELVQKAEFLIGMYSPEYWAAQIPGFTDEQACPNGFTRLDIMKSRYGGTGEYCKLQWLPGMPKFKDAAFTDVNLDEDDDQTILGRNTH